MAKQTIAPRVVRVRYNKDGVIDPDSPFTYDLPTLVENSPNAIREALRTGDRSSLRSAPVVQAPPLVNISLGLETLGADIGARVTGALTDTNTIAGIIGLVLIIFALYSLVVPLVP